MPIFPNSTSRQIDRLPPGKALFAVFVLSGLPLLLVLSAPGLFGFVIPEAPYLVFHNIAEFFSVMVSFSIFGVGWYTYDQTRDGHALFLSTAFLVIGLLDFMHALGNAAMPAFITENSSNKSTQFWIAARLFQAVAFLAGALLYARSTPRLSRRILLAGAVLIPALVFTVITCFPSSLPKTFAPGSGLTPFKKTSEYLVILLLGLAAILYWRKMTRTKDRTLLYVISALLLSGFSELCLAVYTRVFDTYNVLGHIYKVAAFFLIYRGIFVASVKEPYIRLAEGEALRESEERYRSLTELSPDAVVVHRNGEFVYANAAAVALYGAGEAGRIIGTAIADRIHPDFRAAVLERVSRIYDFHAPAGRMEQKHLRFDGREIDVEVAGTPITYGQGPAVLAIIRDISDRKKAVERERQEHRETAFSNRVLRAFVEFEGDALFDQVLSVVQEEMDSRHGVFGYIPRPGHLMCPSLSKMLDVCEVEGKCIHYPPEKWKGLWARALTEKRSLCNNEASPVPPGHPAIHNNLATPILFHGEAIGLLNLANREGGYTSAETDMLDRTAARIAPVLYAWIQRKLREDERKQAQENVQKLNAELKRNLARLEAANRELEAFIYSVSHDLRAPLRSVSGFSGLLLQQYGEGLDDKGKDFLDRVNNSALKMNKIIDDLLHLSRISRHELRREDVDLSGMAESILSECRAENPGRSVAVEITKGIVASADPGLVELAMSNLLRNAWKFSSKQRNAVIEFGAAPGQGGTVYFVKDNGIGFDPKQAERLFMPFQRLHADNEYEGTGIGLAIVDRAVRRHGGSIRAEAGTNQGASFFFTLQ